MLEEDFLKAVTKGDSQQVVRLLGQITNTGLIKDGRNALHLATQHGNADIVSLLLLSGLYNCKTPDTNGYTALQIAAAEGYLEIVKQLIKSGSDVNAADHLHGNTALHEAAWKGYSRTVAELAKAKANLNIKNWGGFTPLHLCCQNGHNQSCRELLLAGCDTDVQNNYGDTPLHASARYGHAGVMRILISAQCHVSDQNKNGDTALHISAAMNRRKLTRILLESNCNKSIVNEQNETAYDIAVRKSHTEILEILKKTILKKNDVTVEAVKSNTKKLGKRSTKTCSNNKKTVKLSSSVGNSLLPWSPYGCHYYPDCTEFPEPKLDSLPSEPLKKGEQYYVDLAGNIRKGPVGVGYACYCAPYFHELETRIEKKNKKIKKQIHKTEDAINKRLNTLEYCLNAQYSSKVNDYQNKKENIPNGSLNQAHSFESIFDTNGSRMDHNDIERGLQRDVFEKRKNIVFLKNNEKDNLNKTHISDSYFQSDKTDLDVSHNHEKYFSSDSIEAKIHMNLWKNSRLNEADSCESSDEECEKVPDIPCNDSGYSTKLCSNSQGPSPSLSGRLENDGMLSVTPSQEEKHLSDMSSFMSTFKNISIKQASIV